MPQPAPETEPGRPPSVGLLGVVLVIVAGGALGSLGRYAVALALPHGPGDLAWSTVLVNLTGAFALGVLMALLPRRWPESRLVRPFWGVGVLGGWTTFSTAMLDLHASLAAGSPVVALAYLAISLGLGLPLALLGLLVARGPERMPRAGAR